MASSNTSIETVDVEKDMVFSPAVSPTTTEETYQVEQQVEEVLPKVQQQAEKEPTREFKLRSGKRNVYAALCKLKRTLSSVPECCYLAKREKLEHKGYNT